MPAAVAPRGTVELVLPTLHPGQREVRRQARRFNVLACGRRWGKNVFGESRVVVTTVKHAAPVGWFAPTYKQLLPTWRELVDHLAPITKQKSEQEHRLETYNGGVLECWSLDEPNTARGRRYARVIVDEAAHVRDLERAWQAVIRPTLTDFEGDAWFNSTPSGLNYFHDLYRRGQDPRFPTWASWQRPTRENPHISRQELEDARLDTPERVYAQEYLAEFLEDAGAVFRHVKDCATATLLDGPELGRAYVMGVDLARRVDFTVVTVMDAATKDVVAIDRFNQVDWRIQYQRIATLADRFDVAGLVVDQTGVGDPPVQELRARLDCPVVGYQMSAMSKTSLIESLALAFEQERVGIPDDPVLLGELLAYSVERLPSGTLRYSAPEGKHDDMAVSLALAWWAAARPMDAMQSVGYGFAPQGRTLAADDDADDFDDGDLYAELGIDPDSRVATAGVAGLFRGAWRG